MNSKKAKIIQSVKQTLESSSVHALPNVCRNEHKTIKIVWFVCFLVSSGACGYFIILAISDFFSYDVVTKIEVKSLNSIGII